MILGERMMLGGVEGGVPAGEVEGFGEAKCVSTLICCIFFCLLSILGWVTWIFLGNFLE